MTTNVTPAVLAAVSTVTTGTLAYVTGTVNSVTIVKRAVFSNTSGSAATISVWVVSSGGSVSSANQLITQQSISSKGSYLAPELVNLVLNAGDTIQCQASASSAINFSASGFVTS